MRLCAGAGGLSEGAGKSPVFVIGDVHGHLDRLIALLDKAEVPSGATVVQLGDLGHFGAETKAGDLACWEAAREGLVDTVLWGNHDRAVVDRNHMFGGYARPGVEVKHLMRAMEADGRLKMAEEAHGWLLTHAGLHKAIKFQGVPTEDINLYDARSIADYINTLATHEYPEAIIDAISGRRGGWNPSGGILWRDKSEKLWEGVPQVFGHSADKHHLVQGEPDKWYCIDIGGKGGSSDPDADCLAGIWLPSQEIVRVDKVNL